MNPLRRLWSALASLAETLWAWDATLREANDAFRGHLHMPPAVGYRPSTPVEAPALSGPPADGAPEPKPARRLKSA
jgi:hypothetical protein